MVVCDVCKASPTEQIKVKLDQEYTLDFCKDCEEYVWANSLIIGIKEQRKHEGPQNSPGNYCPDILHSVFHSGDPEGNGYIVYRCNNEKTSLTPEGVKEVINQIYFQRGMDWLEIHIPLVK